MYREKTVYIRVQNYLRFQASTGGSYSIVPLGKGEVTVLHRDAPFGAEDREGGEWWEGDLLLMTAWLNTTK